MLERRMQRHDAAVVGLLEVREDLRAAARIEHVGARRILALDCRVEHRLQRAVARMRQVVERPARESVDRIGLHARELGIRQMPVARMQVGHDLQIGDQRAQFRGRAEVDAAAAIHVERLVDAVGLHAQQVGAVAMFVQREAVRQVRRVVLRREHLEAVQAGRLCAVARGRLREPFGDRALHAVVERARRFEVELVELIEIADPERREQRCARRRDRLARHEGLHARGSRRRTELDVRGERRIAQRRRDHAAVREQPQVTVGQPLQRRIAAIQEIRRRALRDDQRQHLAERLALFVDVVAGRRRGQDAVHVVEVAAVPCGEAVADAGDFADVRPRGERHRIQIAHDDRAAREHRLRAVQIRADRRGRDLPQLLRRRRGAAVGRMAELLDLRRERAAAGARLMMVDHVQRLIGERAAEASPVDRRIAVRLVCVEQVAVFDEQQRVDDDARHRIEIRVDALRRHRREQRRAGRIEQHQARLILLGVREKQPVLGERHHARGVVRLLADDEAACKQPLLELGDQRIAETPIVRAVRGKADVIARAGLDRVADVARQFGQVMRLQSRRFDFRLHDACNDGDRDQQRGQQGPLDPRPDRCGSGHARQDAIQRPIHGGISLRARAPAATHYRLV
ncbi:hypothetical protein FEP69_06056 [Burkholderia multivorans]|nr:hypothetical protein [Burkholderia multivorans]